MDSVVKLSRTLENVQQGYQELLALWHIAKPLLLSGKRLVLSLREETRSIAQNGVMWSCLEDIATQVQFAIDGKMQFIDSDDVKDILSASLKKHQRVASGLDGGVVFLGQRTSKMTIAQMCEMIDLCHVVGDSHGIKWRRTSWGRDAPAEMFEETTE
jgi:hypothetical protein